MEKSEMTADDHTLNDVNRTAQEREVEGLEKV